MNNLRELGENGVGNVLELIGSFKDLLEINEHEFKVRLISIDLSLAIFSCTFERKQFILPFLQIYHKRTMI